MRLRFVSGKRGFCRRGRGGELESFGVSTRQADRLRLALEADGGVSKIGLPGRAIGVFEEPHRTGNPPLPRRLLGTLHRRGRRGPIPRWLLLRRGAARVPPALLHRPRRADPRRPRRERCPGLSRIRSPRRRRRTRPACAGISGGLSAFGVFAEGSRLLRFADRGFGDGLLDGRFAGADADPEPDQ